MAIPVTLLSPGMSTSHNSSVLPGENLIGLLEQRAQHTPDAVAYTFLPTGEGSHLQITFAQLCERSRQVAAHLKANRVTTDTPVLLLFNPGIDYICAFFGCQYAGAIPVPAYPPTHARQFDRLQAIIDDAATGFALTGQAEMEAMRAIAGKVEGLSITSWVILDEARHLDSAWFDAGLDESRIAFLQYTSGSTSSPKGVMVTHENALTNLRLIAEVTRSDGRDVTMFWLPPYHDFGLIGGILAPLVLGCTGVLMAPSSFLLNPMRWLKAISDFRATITGAPNFAYELCARMITPEQRASLDLSSLRVAFNGAEPIRQSTVERFTEAFAPSGLRSEAWLAAYGLAESTLMVSGRWGETARDSDAYQSFAKSALRENRAVSIDDADAVADDAVRLVSVGDVLPDHDVVIVDPETLRRCDQREVGEIWVSGPCVAKGYWRREADTQSLFAATIDGEPVVDGHARYMRTGDLGFMHNGSLYICARHKDLIIVNGLNIYPQDVELAAFDSHPALREDGTIAFSIESDGTEQLVVVQELNFRAAPDDAMIGRIAAAVSDSAGVPPDVIVLVKAGKLPRTSSGKVRRRQCRQDFLDDKLPALKRWDRPRTGEPSQRAASNGSMPTQAMPVTLAMPVTPDAPVAYSAAEIEAWLRRELAGRMGLDIGSVDPTQPFAFYGLGSMAAVQLAQALSDWLGRPIVPIVFWNQPTIAQLARHLAGDDTSSAMPAQAAPSSAPVSAAGRNEPIAIVGMSCRFPGADGVDAFWTLLQEGRDEIRTAPLERIQAGTFVASQGSLPATHWGGFLDDIDYFDAQCFGISPLEAERMDPQQRLVMEVAWHALEDAGIAASSLAGSTAGVFVGISTHDYEKHQAGAADGLNVYSATGSAPCIAANRLSYLLDLRGPSIAIDTACSSSLVAVHTACQSLRNGEASIALAGGVNLILSTESSQPFANAGMLSPDGRCKTFDASADGYVRGEGCGIIVLKRLSDALRDGDTVRAVIAGSAVMQDGRSNGLVAPNGEAQTEVIRHALRQAGITPGQLGYVEAHGTGTVLGDPIELSALKNVFADEPADAGRSCAVGSVKTNIGHLEAAAGIAGLIKAVLAIERETIPAHLHLHTPNPHCSLNDTRLVVPTSPRQWSRDHTDSAPRYAGISSFGFGGTLAHMVIAEAPAVAKRPTQAWPAQLLMLSAHTENALEQLTAQVAERMAGEPDLALADVAYTLQAGRNAFGWRRMLVAKSREDALAALATPATAPMQRVVTARMRARAGAEVVFMFPGQGAQKLRMARVLYEHVGAFRAIVDDCAQRLSAHLGCDLVPLLYPSDESNDETLQHTLNATRVAQPALFVIEYALARLWMDLGVRPSAMLGHSVGEYVAACLAGVFSLDDALALVAARGALMQALPPGAMLAVPLDEASLIEHLDDELSLAAVNAPQRCVVSGTHTAIAALEARLAVLGVSGKRLATSHAFHSHMMEPALAAFAARVASIALRAPSIPFISNVSGTWISAAEATDPAYWARHLRAPVRFLAGLETLSAKENLTLVEVGPGHTLCTFARLHAGAADSRVAHEPGQRILPTLSREGQPSADLGVLLDSVGRLWLAGQRIDWRVVHGEEPCRRVSLPVYPFQRERHWLNLPVDRPQTRDAIQPDAQAIGLETRSVEQNAMSASQSAAADRKHVIEESLRSMVAKLLRTDASRVDPHAPLLELGADSLVLVQAIRSIDQSYGVVLTIQQLFETLPTIAAIATYLDAQQPADVQPAEVEVPHVGQREARSTAGAGTRIEHAQAASFEPTLEPVAASAGGAPQRVREAALVSARASVASQPVIIGESVARAAPSSVPASATALERLMSQQLDAFSRLTGQQLAVLGGTSHAEIPEARSANEAGEEREPQSVTRQAGALPAPSASAVPPAAQAASASRKAFVPYQPAHVTTKTDAYGTVTPQQRAYLDQFAQRYIERTRGSKALVQRYRPVLSDNRASAGFRFSIKELLYPIVSQRSEGARVWDVDGNEYIDLTMGFGVNLFGHRPAFIMEALDQQLRTGFELGPQTQLAGEVADLVCKLTGMERVTFSNSGTEAVMLALRLARTVSGRKKIAIFAGSFHGWGDDTLAEADPRGGTVPMAPGVQPGAAANTLVFEYGSSETLDLIRQHASELAAVIVEPVQSRRPDMQPRAFLQALRAVTREHGIALIFDEMITGFRLHPGGAQAWFDVRADLVTYGKVVGGGMPAGMVAGSAAYLDAVDGGQWGYGDKSFPQTTTTFFAGTFCKHPLMLAAARAVLTKLVEAGPALQAQLNERTTRLVGELNRVFEAARVPVKAVNCGSLLRLDTAVNIDLLFYHLIERGLYIWEGRNMFLSTAHSDADLARIVEIFASSVQALRDGGFFPDPTPGGGGGGGARPDGRRPSNAEASAARGREMAAGATVAATAALALNRAEAAHFGRAPGAVRAVSTSAQALTDASRTMRFSLSFFGLYGAQYQDNKYRLAVEAGRFADQHGFHALWFPERHFHEFGGLSPNPAVLAAALARETTRIGLRAGSVVLPLHHPVRVAEEWAMVDNLSSGRVGIACASGWHPSDFVFAPENFGNHRELTFERLEQVKALWRGDALRVRDGASHDAEVKLFPMPRQAELPVWITVVGNPDTYRRAGECGAGVLTNLMGQSIEELERNIEIYRSAREQHGHDPATGQVTVLLHTFVGEDVDEARMCAREPFIRYLKASIGLFQNMVKSLGMNVDVASLSEHDREYLLSRAYERYVESSALIGNPESCIAIVRKLQAIGVDEIGCFIDFGIDEATVLAHLDSLDALKRASTAEVSADEDGAALVHGDAMAIKTPGVDLTEAQQGMWFECQYDDAAALAYNTTTVLRLAGRLDMRALEQSFQSVFDRHTALRTVFAEDGATQHVLPKHRFDLPLVDFSRSADASAEIDAWLVANNHRKMDLARGPLMYATVLRTGHDEHLLVLTFHHLVADGLSQEVLLQELAACYSAACANTAPVLSEPVPFSAYVQEQRAYLQSERFRDDEAYWLAQFSGDLPQPLTLPGRGASQGRLTSNAHLQHITLASEQYAQLQALSRKCGATMFMTVCASVAVLLHRLSNQDDLVIGVPMIAGRADAGSAALLGYTLNLAALRCRGTGDTRFVDYLNDIKRTLIGAYSHADYPFGQLLRTLNLPPDPNRRPLASVLFNLNRALSLPQFDGLAGDLLASPVSFGAHELMVDVIQLPDRLDIKFQYNTDLFAHEDIERMLGQFTRLLAGIVAEPESRIGALPLLADDEREQVLRQWQGPVVPLAPGAAHTLHALVEAQVARDPHAEALAFEDTTLSYGELDAAANRLAHYLRAQGVGAEVRVALCLERSAQMVVALLGVLKAGGAYVPLDPAYPRERLAYMLADAAPAVLLTQQALRGVLPATAIPTLCLDTQADEIAGWPATEPAVEVHAQQLAYVTYTSGSTGQPKGVMTRHASAVNYVEFIGREYGLSAQERVLQVPSLSFDASVRDILGCLSAGGRLRVMSEAQAKQAPALAAQLRAERITAILSITPSFLEALAAHAEGAGEASEAALRGAAAAGQRASAYEALRLVLVSGEVLSARVVGAVHRGLGAQVQVVNQYGPTECTMTSTYSRCGGEVVRIGRPLANVRAYVLDETLAPVAVGVTGELYLGGAGVSRGYLGRPALTAERFVPSPFEVGARLYRTGDRARWTAEGELEYQGRMDDQVKIRGFRVEPGEVEAVLGEQPGVREAAVIAREQDGEWSLVAYVVLGGAKPTHAAPVAGTAGASNVENTSNAANAANASNASNATSLREALQAVLPEYMVPQRIVVLERLPLTPNGKLDRRALPVPDMTADRHTYVAPRTATEQAVAEIWCAVLKREQVGVHENFFECGGHSLRATQVFAKIQRRFDVELPLRTLFEAPTVAALALRVEVAQREATAATLPPLVAVGRDGPLALSFAQQRLWFLNQFDGRSAFYNMPAAVRLSGQLDIEALRRTLEAIVARHEALRTRFVAVDGTPVQVIDAPATLALPLTDLSDLPSHARAAAAERLAHEEAQTPFDLARGPLLRARLLRLGDDEHVVLLTLHHIVSDGWSMGVLVREVGVLYAAFVQGQASPLPALPVQYADYAHWQRQWLQGDVLASQLEYWKTQLADAPVLLTLPTDRPRPAVQGHRGAVVDFTVPATTTAALNALSRRGQGTLFMVLAGAFNVLLSRYAGQHDICIGTPIANRTQEQTEALIGVFANTLVLRTQVHAHEPFVELLARMRDTTLSAYAHQDVPFEQLVEVLQPPRSLSHAPLFQVMLVLHNAPLETLALPGLSLQPVREEGETTAKFDLSLNVRERDGQLFASFEYDTGLFDAATIERMAGHFVRLVEGIVADPATRIGELPMVSAAEQEQLVVRWNETAAPYAHEQTLHELFEAQVARTPQAVALVHGEAQLTYGDLNARANRVAQQLRRLGVGADVRVALCVERSVEMVVGLLAVLKAGGAYVPLDPSYPRERLAYMLGDAAPAVLLTQAALLPVLAGRREESEENEENEYATLCLDDEQALPSTLDEPAPEPVPQVHAGPHNLAYVIYTSGSTGRPKGVGVSHRSLNNLLETMGCTPGLSMDDVLLSVTSLSFDIAGLELYLPLTKGARLVLAGREEARDPERLAALIERERVTVMQATPSTWQMLLERGWPASEPGRALKVLCGGEALPVGLAERLLSHVPVIWNLYGPTETTIWSTVKAVTNAQDITIGRPVANTQVYVLDKRLNPVPVGVAGELYIAGAGVARGYLNRPDLSAERFVPNPFGEAGARMYCTGDLARYLPDGNVEYLGRVDHQVKLRGFRIELGEIEAQLARHPLIKACAVIPVKDARNEDRLVAYLVPGEATSDAQGEAVPVHSPRFSLFYFGAQSSEGQADAYRVYMESARFADEHGFEAIWTPERHFHHVGSLYPNPAVLSAALASVTKRIHLRSGSVVMPLHSPIRIAEEWSVVDNLSHGRVGISVASGWVPKDFVLAPQNFADRKATMIAGIGQLRALWGGESLPFVDGTGNLAQISIFPRPVQRELPLWLTSAGNPETFIEAGRLGVNLLTHLLGQTIEEAAAKIALYRQSRAEAGFDPQTGKVTMMVHTFVGDDFDATLARSREPFIRYMRAHLGLLGGLAKSMGIPVSQHPSEAEVEQIASFAFERYSRTASLIGTPASCLGVVRQLYDAGVDEIAGLIDWMDADDALAGLPHLYRLQHLAARPEPGARSLQQYLRGVLPDYMVPSHFVTLDALPLTPNGKLDRRALPAPDLSAEREAYVAPRTATEQTVADIWAEVLKLGSVSVHDNFFDLGGHSLIAAKVMARIKQRLEVDLPLSQLFLTPTAAALANVIDERDPQRRLLVPLRQAGDAAPLYLFHPAGGEVFCYAGLVEALDDAFPVFGIQSPKRAGIAQENDDFDALCASYVDEILTAHDGAPCYIGGWSLGGKIAFQVAWLLEQRGVEVLGVAMLDTIVARKPGAPERSEALVDFLDMLAQSSESQIIQLFGADVSVLHARLKEAAGRFGMAGLAEMIERSDPSLEAEWGFELAHHGMLMRMHARMVATDRTVRRFAPKPIKAPIFSSWADETLAEGHEPTSWWPYSTSGAERVPPQILPGDHNHFILDSRAQAIGRALGEFLHNTRVGETVSQDEPA